MRAHISPGRRLHARLGRMAMFALAAAGMAQAASATGSRADRFALTGSATIKPAAFASGGNFRINAGLVSAGTAEPSSASSYVMRAKLAPVPLVCASEIILSNGFD